jgi:uncharacterized protein (TIGR00255 family)
MIKSMTGFASVATEDAQAALGVSIKTLNHRYLDVQLKMPSLLGSIEAAIRAAIGGRITRGRVELSVSMQLRETPGVDVELNRKVGQALERAFAEARAEGWIAGALTPGDLLRVPQALTIRERASESDGGLMAAVAARVRVLVDEGLTQVDVMRTAEGVHVRADLDDRRRTVASLVERLAAAAADGASSMEQRLAERVAQLRTDLRADETAVAQEIVRTVARSDISEEVARFRGHVSHWQALSDGAEPCGRKLDFLLQEMNREVNTIGSKADGLRVSELVIAAKAELERMREQVQNVE